MLEWYKSFVWRLNGVSVMTKELELFRIDKSAFQAALLTDEDTDRKYWWSKTPEERLLAMEMMRQSIFGYDPLTTRLQRVLTIASLGSG